MKTRYDCKHYWWLQCHNSTNVVFSKTTPKCPYDIKDDVEGCKLFEEGVPPVYSTPKNQYI